MNNRCRFDQEKIAGLLFVNKLEPWTDPNEPVFNQNKHEATCLKNRRKRKKRRK